MGCQWLIEITQFFRLFLSELFIFVVGLTTPISPILAVDSRERGKKVMDHSKRTMEGMHLSIRDEAYNRRNMSLSPGQEFPNATSTPTPLVHLRLATVLDLGVTIVQRRSE